SNAANAYPLQFCLYTLALHRLLRSRVAGYSYDSHFGRVQYVYLRGAGVRAGGAAGAGGRDANSAGYGVYSSRPSAHLIDTLDSLFAGGP
ncbi:MAG: hypothetical protein KJZ83_16145, partial [Burkholderiaceae bacterium]|nr:hypothetical protein [Burkholderiaceae bacterium]